jgi:DNA-binding transcriptional LysR family regulator
VRAGAEFMQPLVAAASCSTLTVNTYFAIMQGVIHGIGIGSLPDYITADVPDLVRILPEAESATIPVYLAYVEELRHSKRVCAFRDFVLEEIQSFRRRIAADASEAGHATTP